MTLDEVGARMRAAGVEIREDRLELVRRLVAAAVGPIRPLDARAAKTLEPAVTFDAAGARGGDGG